MTQFMLDIFVRNQLYLNSKYEGELLIINGAEVDTTDTAMRIRKDFKIDTTNPVLEMYLAYIGNEDSIAFTSGATEVTLNKFLKQFKRTLPVKHLAERLLKKIMPIVVPELSKNIYKDKNEVIGNSLLVQDTNKKYISQAFSHLFGMESTRFIYTVTKTITNGNLLDLNQETLSKLSSIGVSCTSFANFIKAMGYPYSDYRRYVDRGILVSIDIYDNVYMIENDMLYCMSISQFSRVVDGNDRGFLETFKKEYSYDNLANGVCIGLNKETLKWIVEGLLSNGDDI